MAALDARMDDAGVAEADADAVGDTLLTPSWEVGSPDSSPPLATEEGVDVAAALGDTPAVADVLGLPTNRPEAMTTPAPLSSTPAVMIRAGRSMDG